MESLSSALNEQPRARLGLFPTPLHPLSNLAGHMGSSHLYIKRDDLTGLGMGGNKTRGLEFLLGRALERQVETVIASGALESNLCSQVAAACARLGLQAVILHNDDPPEELTGNALLSHLAGAEMRYLGPTDENEREQRAMNLACEMEREAFVVRRGGSTPRGSLGYVVAAVELARQVKEHEIPIDHVVIVGAMGGTAAGLLAGNALLGSPFSVHIISVEYSLCELRKRLEILAFGALDLLRCSYRSEEIFSSVRLYDEYLGPGYAIPDEGTLRAARAAASTEGIFCETVYVAKTLAGAMGLVQSGCIPAEEGVCFFHTGGHPSLFGQRKHLLS